MFIILLFIIAKSSKQPRCFSVGEWINKQWYIQRVNSVVKRNELLIHSATWVNLKSILLNERKPSEKL